MSRWYVLALAALPLLLSFFRPPRGPDLAFWTTHGLQKIRPFDWPPKEPSREVKISAARNEFEPFQIVLRAEDRDVEAVDVEVTDLRGAGDVLLPQSNISIYLERYLELKIPSSVEGGAGEWPDPLVPRVDSYTNERRNSFPFKLSKGRNQPIWIDVYVPLRTPAGLYRGTVWILVEGKRSLSIPVELQVWNFELPSTSSLITTFAFSSAPALKRHYGQYTSDKDLADLTSVYQKAALRHRITLDASSSFPPALTVRNGDVQVDWQKYDNQISPFLDGHVFTRDQPLPGARFTSVVLHTPQALRSTRHQIQFWRQAAEHFRKRGWFDRLFNYLWDEPAPDDYPAMIRRGEMVRRAEPSVKNLVTAPLQPEWSSFVDIWTPVVNCFESKPGYSYCRGRTVSRSEYEGELSKGKRLWWYQSCASHGCNVVGGDYFRGWPDYMIDHSPVRNRIMEWLTWKYEIGGELYFNTNEAYFKKNDPWADVHLFGGNGDGTLFYPGLPDVIGGRAHIPVESIRLKLIREGLEDYEYLALLAKLRGVKAAAQPVDSFIRNAYDFDQDPQKLYSAREEMGRQLSGDRK